MKLLLDTHALLWTMSGDSRLSPAAREAIEGFDNEIYVSVVNVWEAATKFRKGKLPEAARLATDPGSVFVPLGYEVLPVTLEHARLAGSFTSPHKDPFDRMLAAQALLEGLTLVSLDKAFQAMLIPLLW